MRAADVSSAGTMHNPPVPPVALARAARRTLVALAEVVVPPSPAVARRDERLLAFAGSYLAYLPPLSRHLLPLGLWLFEWGTLLFAFSWRPFSRLPLAARRRYFRAWQRSRSAVRRQLAKGIKALLVMGFFDMPEVCVHLGYRPDSFVRQRVQERADELARHGLDMVIDAHAAVPPAPSRSELMPPRPPQRQPEPVRRFRA